MRTKTALVRINMLSVKYTAKRMPHNQYSTLYLQGVQNELKVLRMRQDYFPQFFIYFIIYTHSTGTYSKVNLYEFYIGSGLFPSVRPPWASWLEVPDSQRPPALAPLACIIIYPVKDSRSEAGKVIPHPTHSLLNRWTSKLPACPHSVINLCLFEIQLFYNTFCLSARHKQLP